MADPRNPTVTMETTEGTIRIELLPGDAPETVESFLGYARDGFFDDTIFHRVIPGFMIQGGGFTEDMQQKATGPSIQNEAGPVANARGTLAMARTSDPHSATAQFFINVSDNAFLDKARAQDGWGYCAFGRVIEGMDVVDAISTVATGNVGGHGDVPTEAILIKTATVEE